MLNKEKIRPSANAKVDEILRDAASMNAISLWQCRDAFCVPLVQWRMVIGILLSIGSRTYRCLLSTLGFGVQNPAGSNGSKK